MSRAYYNEFDPKAAAWLRQLITMGLIAPGDVDERSIKDVTADDVRGYTQAHFFAGIGGWSYAARLAGWPDSRPLWTGSCPCQPFSVAGQGRGEDDERHLWPDLLRLTSAVRPPVLMGEQVAGKAGYGWLDGVRSDLEGEGYASRGVDIPACAVDAPHIRQRLYWVAVANADQLGSPTDGRDPSEVGRLPQAERQSEHRTIVPWRGDAASEHDLAYGNTVDDTLSNGQLIASEPLRTGRSAPDLANESSPHLNLGHPLREGLERQSRYGPDGSRRQEPNRSATASDVGFWSEHEWIICHDGKARRTEPGVPLLANGVSYRVDKWRGFGNAIVPQVAAEVIRAFMDIEEVI